MRKKHRNTGILFTSVIGRIFSRIDIIYKSLSLNLERSDLWPFHERAIVVPFYINNAPSSLNCSQESGESTREIVMAEVGCGVGNCVFPLLEDNSRLFIFALDFAPSAIDFVKVIYISSFVPFVQVMCLHFIQGASNSDVVFAWNRVTRNTIPREFPRTCAT
jgi:hypothetical protein